MLYPWKKNTLVPLETTFVVSLARKVTSIPRKRKSTAHSMMGLLKEPGMNECMNE